MKGFAIRAALVVWGVLASFFVVSLTPAHAVAEDCRTVSSHLVNRPDGGNGTPPVWALDTMTRTVTVCHPPEVAPQAQAAQVVIATWTYTAELVDSGTFVTKGSATGSPNDGAALTAGQSGTVSGTAAFANFTAPHDWGYWNAEFDGKTFAGSAPSSTGDWLKNLWSDGLGKTEITAYKWTYKTCLEQWVDSSDKDNDDGQSDTAGDITGKPCPSTSVSASPSLSVSAPTMTNHPTLPVTGSSNTGMIVLAGGVLVAAGGALLSIRRRRRPKFLA